MAKRGGFPGGAMPGNMANLMKQALTQVDQAAAGSMSKLTGGMNMPGMF